MKQIQLSKEVAAKIRDLEGPVLFCDETGKPAFVGILERLPDEPVIVGGAAEAEPTSPA